MLVLNQAVDSALFHCSPFKRKHLRGVDEVNPLLRQLRKEQMLPSPKGTITIQCNGRNYPGHYRFAKGLLMVHYADKHKYVVLHPSWDPEPMAKLMLADIIKKVLGR
jgi:hypothetical protein